MENGEVKSGEANVPKHLLWSSVFKPVRFFFPPEHTRRTLTGHNAPRLDGDHLVVNGRDTDQQDDPEQDAL